MSKFHLVILGTALPEPGHLDGASRICLEVMSRWTRNGHAEATIITSPKRQQTCRNVGFEHTQYVDWPDCPGVWSMFGHIRSAFRTSKLAKRLPKPATNLPIIIYSASDFYPDVWAARQLHKRWTGSTWIASRFLFVPHPCKGWKHAYENRWRFPDPMLVLGQGYQKIAFHSIKKANAWLITNEVDKAYFPARIDRDRIKPAYGGVHYHEIAATPTPKQEKKYDGVFCGRISPQKGVLDLVDIWEIICKQKPDAKLALIGNGHKPFEDQLKAAIASKGLTNNIEWFGFLDGEKKHVVYRQSRVFLHTSVYDNYGMAACEAMAAGVPAVMYDLPPLRVAYPQGALKARLNDQHHFAELVLQLVRNESEYATFSGLADAWALTQDWNRKSEEILEFFESIKTGIHSSPAS